MPRSQPSLRFECVGNFEHDLLQSALDAKIDPKLLLAVIHVESKCNLRAHSSSGAVGYVQILPSTAKFVGVNNPANARENIKAGARYLRVLQDQFKSNIRLSLAAYNAGPGAVRKYKGVPPFTETQAYVRKVLKVYRQPNKAVA